MNVVQAILLKVMSALLFAVMATLVRFLSERYPVGQIVFLRSAFAILPVVLIYAWRNELAAAVRARACRARPDQHRRHVLQFRGVGPASDRRCHRHFLRRAAD